MRAAHKETSARLGLLARRFSMKRQFPRRELEAPIHGYPPKFDRRRPRDVYYNMKASRARRHAILFPARDWA